MGGKNTALLPCPFCGSPAELERDNDHHGEWFNLGCSRHWGRVDPDEACIGGRLFYTESEKSEGAAIAAWNARAVKPLDDEIKSRLRGALRFAASHSALTAAEEETILAAFTLARAEGKGA